MMQGASTPRIVPEEAFAEELRRRHGERALLIEARTGGDGRVGLLAVLDLEGEALADEAKRHEARREVGPAVEVIDRPTWLAMRRLAASGMITLAEGQSRVLHQSPALAAAADPSFDPQARAAELRGEAERSLRMARVLGRRFPRRGAAAHCQGDRHRCSSEARGARRDRGRSLRCDASTGSRPGRSWHLGCTGGGGTLGSMVRCWRAHCCRRGIPHRDGSACYRRVR